MTCFQPTNLQELTIEMFQDTLATSDEEDTVRLKTKKNELASPLNQDHPDLVADTVYESQVSVHACKLTPATSLKDDIKITQENDAQLYF